MDKPKTQVKKEVVAQEHENGVTKPKEGTISHRIWEISDSLSTDGAVARRKDVIEQAESEGINTATASTQYGKWRKFYDIH